MDRGLTKEWCKLWYVASRGHSSSFSCLTLPCSFFGPSCAGQVHHRHAWLVKVEVQLFLRQYRVWDTAAGICSLCCSFLQMDTSHSKASPEASTLLTRRPSVLQVHKDTLAVQLNWASSHTLRCVLAAMLAHTLSLALWKRHYVIRHTPCSQSLICYTFDLLTDCENNHESHSQAWPGNKAIHPYHGNE